MSMCFFSLVDSCIDLMRPLNCNVWTYVLFNKSCVHPRMQRLGFLPHFEKKTSSRSQCSSCWGLERYPLTLIDFLTPRLSDLSNKYIDSPQLKAHLKTLGSIVPTSGLSLGGQHPTNILRVHWWSDVYAGKQDRNFRHWSMRIHLEEVGWPKAPRRIRKLSLREQEKNCKLGWWHDLSLKSIPNNWTCETEI